ncbi:MAG: ribonuclease Z [Candidatus Diapherotrites archaeon]|nr:ribonuclease Z [Candidatus Diapherotrites archaeon]
MRIVFLGTAASLPSKNRGLACLGVRFLGEVVLFDCPEGTQQAMMKAKLSYGKISNIFISHWHEDHFLGLLGLIQTQSLNERTEPLHIWGPKMDTKYLKLFKKIITGKKQTYPIEIHEVKVGKLYEKGEFTVSAVKLKHTVPSFGYILIEKLPSKFNKKKAIKLGVPEGPMFKQLQSGKAVKVKGKTIKPEQVLKEIGREKKLCYFVDTIPLEENIKHIKDADILIHEVTFSELEEERAKEMLHSTGKGVAKLAKKANVKRLIGTHISARFKDTKELVKEMSSVFPNSHIAKDLEEVQL